MPAAANSDDGSVASGSRSPLTANFPPLRPADTTTMPGCARRASR